MTDLVIGKPLHEALAVHESFLTLMQGRGVVEEHDPPDPERRAQRVPDTREHQRKASTCSKAARASGIGRIG